MTTTSTETTAITSSIATSPMTSTVPITSPNYHDINTVHSSKSPLSLSSSTTIGDTSSQEATLGIDNSYTPSTPSHNPYSTESENNVSYGWYGRNSSPSSSFQTQAGATASISTSKTSISHTEGLIYLIKLVLVKTFIQPTRLNISKYYTLGA